MNSKDEKIETETSPPVPPETWDRCHAYIERKHKFCRQLPARGRKYCGNHGHLEELVYHPEHQSDSNPSRTTPAPRKRIPCPVDPSHMIYADSVERHIPICPKSKKLKRETTQKYFTENINSGGYGRLSTARTVHPSKTGAAQWARRVARRILQVHQSIFLGERGSGSNIDVPSLTFQQIHDALPMKDLSQPEIDAGIVQGFQSHHIRSGDVYQLASLIGHLRTMRVLPEMGRDKPSATTAINGKRPPLVFLEMGAGRGMFGLAAASVFNATVGHSDNPHLIMVERAGSRSKADKAFRNIPTNPPPDTSYMRLHNVNWSRCSCDLSHINLPVLLQDQKFSDAKVVVIAKHLCGAGTDLALKSMASIQGKVRACIFATCCHGICDWQHYVGRDYLRNVMEGEEEEGRETFEFGAEEFDLLRRWCAASVAINDCHTITKQKVEVKGEEEQHNPERGEHFINHTDTHANVAATSISSVVRDLDLTCGVQGLGRACQRLIDFGRYEYLRNQIFSNIEPHQKKLVTKLSHYVPPKVTPQNAVLWAYCEEEMNGTANGYGPSTASGEL